MENPMFDELSFQIFEKNEKSKNRIFRNFVHFCLGEVQVSFGQKGWDFLVFQCFTPRRKVVESCKLKGQGSFFMENPIFDELSFQIFEKMEIPKIVTFRKSENPQIQKVDLFFRKIDVTP